MPAAAIARDHLESLLRDRKLDQTIVDRPDDGRWTIGDGRSLPTGITNLDARLGGGFPRGHLSEIVGARSSGRSAIAVSALAGATARGEAVALIDPLDMFDPVSASACGVDFERVLWIRGEAIGAARVSLSSEYGTLQKSVDRAVKSLNLVLQAGGFGLVMLDFAEVSAHAIKRLPYTTWLRLHRIIEGSDTGCVLIGSEPIARSSGGVSLHLTRPTAQSLEPTARVVRSRSMEIDQHVRVPLSAAAC